MSGVVREWHDEEAWGVVDSEETPGGCWVHAAQVAGIRTLAVGQPVELEWEAAEQDGYPYRAVRVWPSGTDPFEPEPHQGPSSAYRSHLTITFDDPSA